jgi:synaptobrevin homolog YKT6
VAFARQRSAITPPLLLVPAQITKIQRDLDDTTNVLHKTIESVLERGVKLDDLVDRSDSLSRQSKMFYKQAKKTNSCCTVM